MSFEHGIRVDHTHDEQLLRIELDAPPGNVLDRAAIETLTGHLERAAKDERLHVAILGHAGKHFSFGASVPEHLPGQVEEMLPAFHALARALHDFPVPILAVVRGKCLGGGMEVVTLCSMIFAAPDARFGQPEIQLGVFAPVGSCLLPGRIGPTAAADLLLSGRTVSAAEAERLGLLHQVVDDPGAAALAYAREHLLTKSAFSLRRATRALQIAQAPGTFEDRLERTERLYLDDLMKGADPIEGLKSFVERRTPVWSNE